MPFIAVDALSSRNAPHLPVYDLESIYYVLLWICMGYNGPCNTDWKISVGNKSVFPEEAEGAVMHSWVHTKSFLDCAKLGQFHHQYFEDTVLSQFSPYFKEFKPYAKKFRDLFFPLSGPRNVATHDDMIAIFDAAIHKLSRNSNPRESNTVPPLPPMLHSSLHTDTEDESEDDATEAGSPRPQIILSNDDYELVAHHSLRQLYTAVF